MLIFSLLVVLLQGVVVIVRASFVFEDFNITTGLSFNGDAGTTNCFNNPLNLYGDYQGIADRFDEDSFIERGETTVLISESIVETNIASYNNETNDNLAGFLNRNDTIQSPNSCLKERIRLTPSGPSKIGSIWFNDPVPVNNGFDTFFSFQISDHSKQCTLNKDQYFTMVHHRTCSVHGADGFAFVIQFSPFKTKAIGKVGNQMGFGGIENSLAIAFDTWQNQGDDLIGVDHIKIQSLGEAANTALTEGLLGFPKAYTLANGQIHRVRIAYYNELKSDYFTYLIASNSLLPYLKDNGEQKRIGTLILWIDDGIEQDIPLLALPINLSLLLKLPTDRAYVGFTASTGRFYEKHDLLSWEWCDQPPCSLPSIKILDYHQGSKKTLAEVQDYEPGVGYGGGDADTFPTKNESPDTTPWEMEMSSFATSRNIGLADDAEEQVPPNTLY